MRVVFCIWRTWHVYDFRRWECEASSCHLITQCCHGSNNTRRVSKSEFPGVPIRIIPMETIKRPNSQAARSKIKLAFYTTKSIMCGDGFLHANTLQCSVPSNFNFTLSWFQKMHKLVKTLHHQWQPHWQCNVLTNLCLCWNNKSLFI